MIGCHNTARGIEPKFVLEAGRFWDQEATWQYQVLETKIIYGYIFRWSVYINFHGRVFNRVNRPKMCISITVHLDYRVIRNFMHSAYRSVIL